LLRGLKASTEPEQTFRLLTRRFQISSRKPLILHGKKKPLSTLATFINSTRLNLQAFGLERRAKQIETLDSVIADITLRRAPGHQYSITFGYLFQTPRRTGRQGLA
jgi:hypothetical protein